MSPTFLAWAPVEVICQIRKFGRRVVQAGKAGVCLGGMLIWKLNIQIRCEVGSWLRRKVGAGNINLGVISIESGTGANEVG